MIEFPFPKSSEQTERPESNEDRVRSQHVMELARDLVYNLERLPNGKTLTLEVTSRGNNLFDGVVRSTDSNKKVSIGQGRDFRLIKEKAS